MIFWSGGADVRSIGPLDSENHGTALRSNPSDYRVDAREYAKRTYASDVTVLR